MPVKKSLRFATWNIGGGYVLGNEGRFDTKDLDYFAAEIVRRDMDAVFLQEAHSYENMKENQIERLAARLKIEHFLNFPISESHLENEARLSIGIVSKYKLANSALHRLRNPQLRSLRPDGSEWRTFDKGYFTAELQLQDEWINCVSGHSFPFHHFGRNADENEFKLINKQINELISQCSKVGPTIVAADMNFACPEVLHPALSHSCFTRAFGPAETTPQGQHWDHIFVDKRLNLTWSMIVKGKADHFLCCAEVQLDSTPEGVTR